VQHLRAKAARAHQALQRLRRVDTTPLRAAGRSFVDPELPVERRRALLDEAMGPSLTDAVHSVAQSLAALNTLAPAGHRLGRSLEDALRPAGKLRESLASSCWASFLPQDLAREGAALDRLLVGYRQPEFRGAIERAVQVLRVAARMEMAALSQIAVEVPREVRAPVRAALAGYLTGLARLSARSLGVEREVTVAAARLLRLGAVGTEPTLSPTQRSRALAGQVAKLARLLPRVARRVNRAVRAADALEPSAEELAALNQQLERDLSRLMRVTPQARAAMRELAGDLTSAGRLLLGGLRIAGAMRNSAMPAPDRARVIKESAEGLGPIFVKVLQTAVNHPALRAELLGSDTSVESPVLLALRSLQDRVSPMPPREVRRQLRASLSPAALRDLVAFSETPLAAGSIGQVHRATLREGGRLVDVVVKVQRPDLEERFEDTLRVTRLATALAREALTALTGAPADLRRAVSQVTDAMETTLPDLVRSFQTEIDFEREIAATRRFAEQSAGDQRIRVPRIYGAHSGKRVITMELLRGERLSSFVARCGRAQEARATPIAAGPLRRGDPEADAVERARVLAVRAFGLEPRAVTTASLGGGYQVRLRFDHPVQHATVIRVGPDGSARVEGPTPDLSLAALQRLRSAMTASFAAQHLIHRNIHGDLHEGNLLVLGNGRELGLIDFGSTVEPSGPDYHVAGRLLVGWFLRSYPAMARALVAMSTAATLALVERATTCSRIEQQLRRLLPDLKQSSARDLLEATLQATAAGGAALSAIHFRWIKASVSMHGTLSGFDATLSPMDGGDRWKVARDLLGALRRRAARRGAPGPEARR